MKSCKQCNKKLHGNSKIDVCRVCLGECEIQKAIEQYREKQIFLSEYELTNDRFNLLTIEDVSVKELRKVWIDYYGRLGRKRLLYRYHRCFKKNVPRNKRGRKRVNN